VIISVYLPLVLSLLLAVIRRDARAGVFRACDRA